MKNPIISKYPKTSAGDGTRYDVAEIGDLLIMATVNGDLDVDGKQPIHYVLAKMGFFNLKIGDEDKDKTSLYELKTSSGETQHVTAEFTTDIEGLFDNSIVIFPIVKKSKDNKSYVLLSNTEYDLKHCWQDQLKSSRLVIIPIFRESDAHFTVFILDHQNEQGYYFDPFGHSDEFFEQYCENIGYEYSYNEKQVQFDVKSCGPIIVEFIFHAIDCLRNKPKQEISTDGMPEFRQGTEAYNEMLRHQKEDLISPLDFSACIIGMAHYRDESCRNQEAKPDTIPEKKPIINSNSSNNLYYRPLTTALGMLIGMGIGYSITMIPAANQVITTFLANNLHIESAKAEIIFSISSTVICAAIFGVVGYMVGNAVETRASPQLV